MSKNMLLFKVLSDSDDGKEDGYVKAISQNFDLNVTPVSVLKFVFQNEELLLEQLRDPGAFDGLILTSPRSVEAVLTAFKALSEDGTVPAATVAQAIQKYKLQADKINPLYA